MDPTYSSRYSCTLNHLWKTEWYYCSQKHGTQQESANLITSDLCIVGVQVNRSSLFRSPCPQKTDSNRHHLTVNLSKRNNDNGYLSKCIFNSEWHHHTNIGIKQQFINTTPRWATLVNTVKVHEPNNLAIQKIEVYWPNMIKGFGRELELELSSIKLILFKGPSPSSSPNSIC